MASSPRLYQTLSVIFAVLFILALTVSVVFGWTNPAQNPPGGSGVLTAANGKLGIGTSNPSGVLSVDHNTSNPGLVVTNGATTEFIVDANGRVGVGTGVLQTFERMRIVNPDLNASTQLTIGGAGGNTGSLQQRFVFSADNISRWGVLRATSDGVINNYFSIYHYNDAVGTAVNKNRLIIGDNGFVGIGNSVPRSRFHIQNVTGEGNSYLQIPTVIAVPPATECDELIEAGRMVVRSDAPNQGIYICKGITGWSLIQ